MPFERPMSVRIIKQKQEKQIKSSTNGETISSSPVLIESMLLLMPDQPQTPIVSFEQKQTPNNSSSMMMNSFDPSRLITILEQSSTVPSTTTGYRRASAQRVHVPVHNASQWFNGPNMRDERSDRMEKVVSSLFRRSFRPSSNYA